MTTKEKILWMKEMSSEKLFPLMFLHFPSNPFFCHSFRVFSLFSSLWCRRRRFALRILRKRWVDCVDTWYFLRLEWLECLWPWRGVKKCIPFLCLSVFLSPSDDGRGAETREKLEDPSQTRRPTVSLFWFLVLMPIIISSVAPDSKERRKESRCFSFVIIIISIFTEKTGREGKNLKNKVIIISICASLIFSFLSSRFMWVPPSQESLYPWVCLPIFSFSDVLIIITSWRWRRQKQTERKKVIVRLIKYTGLLPVFSEYDSRTWKTSFPVQSCRITDTNTFDSWERKKQGRRPTGWCTQSRASCSLRLVSLKLVAHFSLRVFCCVSVCHFKLLLIHPFHLLLYFFFRLLILIVIIIQFATFTPFILSSLKKDMNSQWNETLSAVKTQTDIRTEKKCVEKTKRKRFVVILLLLCVIYGVFSHWDPTILWLSYHKSCRGRENVFWQPWSSSPSIHFCEDEMRQEKRTTNDNNNNILMPLTARKRERDGHYHHHPDSFLFSSRTYLSLLLSLHLS